ncbi:MAG: hypothetical protein QM776_09150 [Rhodocyclaceae bacterium]
MEKTSIRRNAFKLCDGLRCLAVVAFTFLSKLNLPMSKPRKSLLVLPAFVALVSPASGAEKFDCVTNNFGLMQQASSLQSAFQRSDVKVMVDMTYSVLVKTFGRSEYESAAKTALDKMAERQTSIDSFSLEQPNETYRDKQRYICFVPVNMIVSVGSVRVSSQSFLVSVYENRKWGFFDSNVLSADPELLFRLFPSLPHGLRTPPVATQRIQ